MKLSVCMVTYNQEKFVAEAINSVINQQTNFRFEIIIGVDASTDSTLEIVKSYASKNNNIYVISHPKQIGYPRNLMHTIAQSRTKYIALLDGDDTMLPGKLQKQVDYLDHHPEFVLVGHAMRTFDSTSGKTIKIENPPIKKHVFTIEDFLKYGSIFTNSSKIFRRNAYPDCLTKYRINYIADHFITLHILRDQKAGYIPEILGEYRIHKDSLMQNVKGKETFEDINTIHQSLSETYKQKYDHLFSNRKAYGELIYGIDELKKNNIAEARKLLLMSIKTRWNYTKAQYYYLVLSFFPKFLKNLLIK